VVAIAAVGTFKAHQTRQPVTPILIGAVVLLILLSLLDIFGGVFSIAASAIAMLALVATLLVDLPALFAATQHQLTTPNVTPSVGPTN
jgi:hypothetical protein